MNILITGGAGFIGSNIAEEYVRLGHSVVVVDNLSTGFIENVPKGTTFYQVDLRTEELDDIMDRHEIEIINHHAAQIDVRHSVANPQFDLSVNVMATLNLLEAARKRSLERFIFASTGGAIYGEQDYFPADEQHPTRPISPYGITKLTVEHYLHYYHVVHGLDYTVFRYTNVYGPRQSPHGEAGVVAIFAEKILNGEQPVINGSGLQTRDYVFVQDVVRANVLALDMEGTDTFNVCTAVEKTVLDVFRGLVRVSGKSVKEEHAPEKAGEQMRSVCSYQKIKERLGWEPRVFLDEGLEITYEYFKEKHERA
ncbi:MAG: NAD-dependent epimerase/dehydratase family protein [Chlorobi bacterium]|nr:NAD-dependent epimerase/dehydratase family protein [Chlorobiota bacterium]